MKQQAEVFVDRFKRQLGQESNNCAAMEGLAATLGVLAASGDESSALAERIRAPLMSEASKLPGLQIQPGQTQMTLGGGAYLSSAHLAPFRGAFLFGKFAPTTRIDAAAHCLSALVMIEEQRLLVPELGTRTRATK